jgi:hypothetical protein
MPRCGQRLFHAAVIAVIGTPNLGLAFDLRASPVYGRIAVVPTENVLHVLFVRPIVLPMLPSFAK